MAARRLLREYESLCTLGLPTRDLVPMALRLLERAVGGGMFSFVWADADLQAVDAYMLEPVSEVFTRIYAEEFYNRREAEVGPTFSEILRDKTPVVNFSRFGSRMFESAMYREIFHAVGMPHALRAPVIDGERRYGMFNFTRPPGSRFGDDDEAVVVRAARYLAFAFELERTRTLLRGDTVEGAQEGCLVFDRAGTLQYGCEVGLRLLYDATRADGVAQQAADTRRSLPGWLVEEAMKGGPTRPVTLSNRRGDFVFRPFLLQSPTPGGAPAMVAATVRRLGSLSTRLWEESARFGLSARERQIAVLLALGHGYEAIAAQFEIGFNTVVSHVRRIYEKLGISQRDQLLRALLLAPRPGAI